MQNIRNACYNPLQMCYPFEADKHAEGEQFEDGFLKAGDEVVCIPDSPLCKEHSVRRF